MKYLLLRLLHLSLLEIAHFHYVQLINNFLLKNEIYNISDDKPTSAEEVAMYGVKLLGVDKPKTIEINEIESEMLKNFYKDSKKVDNKKMKEFFSYKLKYPTYAEGLNYIFNNTI